MGRIFSANSCHSRFDPRPEAVRPPLSHCKPVCGTSVNRIASVYLREIEPRCWGVFGPLLQGTVLPDEMSEAVQRASSGDWTISPVSRQHFLPLTAPSFASLGFGKMPRVRAIQRVRKKSRIKRWLTACHTAPQCGSGMTEKRVHFTVSGLFSSN